MCLFVYVCFFCLFVCLFVCLRVLFVSVCLCVWYLVSKFGLAQFGSQSSRTCGHGVDEAKCCGLLMACLV